MGNPDIVERIGEMDDRVNVLRFDREAGDTIIVANYGNHADTIGGNLASADWPGFARRTVERSIEGTKCIFINGIEGDVGSMDCFWKDGDLNNMELQFDDVMRGYAHARHMGNVVAGAVLSVYEKVNYIDIENIVCTERQINVPSNMPTQEELQEARQIYNLHMEGRDDELPYEGMMLINEAKCGTILALDKRYVAGEKGVGIEAHNPFSLERYKRIPEDTDYCTIWFGINDTAHTILGTIEDTTNETFYGAWNVVLEWFLIHRPYMKIGIIVTDANAHPAWRKATRECAQKWGIPYLDMMGDDKVPVIMGREPELNLCNRADELRKKSFEVSEKNGHPNLKAHEYQSFFIESFLRSL